MALLSVYEMWGMPRFTLDGEPIYAVPQTSHEFSHLQVYLQRALRSPTDAVIDVRSGETTGAYILPGGPGSGVCLVNALMVSFAHSAGPEGFVKFYEFLLEASGFSNGKVADFPPEYQTVDVKITKTGAKAKTKSQRQIIEVDKPKGMTTQHFVARVGDVVYDSVNCKVTKFVHGGVKSYRDVDVFIKPGKTILTASLVPNEPLITNRWDRLVYDPSTTKVAQVPYDRLIDLGIGIVADVIVDTIADAVKTGDNKERLSPRLAEVTALDPDRIDDFQETLTDGIKVVVDSLSNTKVREAGLLGVSYRGVEDFLQCGGVPKVSLPGSVFRLTENPFVPFYRTARISDVAARTPLFAAAKSIQNDPTVAEVVLAYDTACVCLADYLAMVVKSKLQLRDRWV